MRGTSDALPKWLRGGLVLSVRWRTLVRKSERTSLRVFTHGDAGEIA